MKKLSPFEVSTIERLSAELHKFKATVEASEMPTMAASYNMNFDIVTAEVILSAFEIALAASAKSDPIPDASAPANITRAELGGYLINIANLEDRMREAENDIKKVNTILSNQDAMNAKILEANQNLTDICEAFHARNEQFAQELTNLTMENQAIKMRIEGDDA